MKYRILPPTMTALLALTAFVNTTHAQSTTWAGPGNNFNTAGNWSNALPDSTTAAVFTGSTPTSIDISANITALGLEFTTGGYAISSANSSTLTVRGGGIDTAASLGTITISGPVNLAAVQDSNIAAGTTVNINSVSATGGLSFAGSNIVFGKSGQGVLTLSGTRAGAGFTISSSTALPPILHVSDGTLNLNTTVTSPATQNPMVLAASGTAAINALKRDQFGSSFNAILRLSGDAAFNVASGLNPGGLDALRFRSLNFGVNQAGTSTAGGGAFSVGGDTGITIEHITYNAANGTGTTATIVGGGTVAFRNGNNDGRGVITVNDSANTSKELQIDATIRRFGADNTNTETLTKAGAGTLVLTANNPDLAYQTFLVSAGTLLINNTAGSATGRSNVVVAAGATLGGTGYIAPIINRSVTFQAGSILSPGDVDDAGLTQIGKLTATVTGSGLVNLSAGANFVFDLSSDFEAGVTYDFLDVNGIVALGSGQLDFSDFTFNTLSGFGVGEYELIAASGGFTGSLGTAFGTIDGYDAFLAIDGNSLLLTVVPEPSTWLLFAAGMAFLVFRKPFHRRCS